MRQFLTPCRLGPIPPDQSYWGSVSILFERNRDRLHAILDGMDPIDREVLALRHFEELTNAETATALGLSVSAASKRYIRAVERLRTILVELSSLSTEGQPP